MSNPDWANMEFNLNNSDDEDDDEDEQRRQAEEAEARRQAEEAGRQAAEVAAQRKMFEDVGIDPGADIDEAGLEPHIQRELAEERQRIQQLQNQASIANLLPGNEGRYTVDAQGIVYDRGKRINGGKRRRKTRRRTRKSKKSKKSKKSRRHRR
jgi:hypothetical protein